MSLTFHRNVFMPARIRELGKIEVVLYPTRHARNAAATERFGGFEIPARIAFCGLDVVEAEVEDKKLNKLVVRLPHNANYDAIFIFLVPSGTLKTCYLNEIGDLHRTLDTSPYEKDGRNYH